jgi:hypothetical protein
MRLRVGAVWRPTVWRTVTALTEPLLGRRLSAGVGFAF